MQNCKKQSLLNKQQKRHKLHTKAARGVFVYASSSTRLLAVGKALRRSNLFSAGRTSIK